MFNGYAEIATDLIVNIAAIFLLAYVLYFRRHRRADLLLSYVALNIGIFVAISLLTTVRVDIALGFGLFAILSIIRLRSTSVTQQEVAYYFVALVLGLVNGMDIPDRRLVVMINVVLLGAMAIVDSRGLRERTRRMDVHLDVVHADDASLVADLERRLGGTVLHHEVNDIDEHALAHVVDVVHLVVKHGADQASLQVGDQGGVVGVDDVQVDVHAAGALAQPLAVDDRHGAQQQHVDQHDQPAVGDVHPVHQAHHQGDEVVGDLLLGHRRRPQPDDRQDGEEAEAQCDVHAHRGQQRDRHEDADVECDVGQQQVRAPVATEVQHVGQQEDRCDVDEQ